MINAHEFREAKELLTLQRSMDPLTHSRKLYCSQSPSKLFLCRVLQIQLQANVSVARLHI